MGVDRTAAYRKAIHQFRQASNLATPSNEILGSSKSKQSTLFGQESYELVGRFATPLLPFACDDRLQLQNIQAMQQFIEENEKVYLDAFNFLNQHALSKVEQEAMEDEIAEFAHSCYARLNGLSSGPEYRTTQSMEHVQAVLSFLADVSVVRISQNTF